MSRALLVALVLVAGCNREPTRAPPPAVIGETPARAALMPQVAIDVSEGLSSPESIVHDPRADVYLVSNIHGDPDLLDDNGYISRISPTGDVLDARWIDGASPTVTLHAPRGMALHGDTLYVVDRDAVRLFDRTTGEPRASWPVPEASFPNDIRVDETGAAYVTETAIHLMPEGPVPRGVSTIWKFSPEGAATAVARGDELAGPNGIVLTADGLVIASFLGHDVYRLIDGHPRAIATLPTSQLDGLVELPDGTFVVTSWEAKGLYHIELDGRWERIMHGADLVGPASIDYDRTRQRLLVPFVKAGQLRFEPYPVASASD